MITKRQAIELIQHRLTGGDTPEDLRRLYPRSVISRVINLALADIVSANPYDASDMAVPYVFTPATDANGYYVTLNPQPVAGSLAIFTVTDEGTGSNEYIVQTKAEANAMKVLRGANSSAAILYNNKLRFNKRPEGDVTVVMVPNVYQMADDDVLIIPYSETGRGEVMLLQACMQILTTQQFQDDLNNDSVDGQNMQNQVSQ
jgi:hypothetical protein